LLDCRDGAFRSNREILRRDAARINDASGVNLDAFGQHAPEVRLDREIAVEHDES
jgi:hypothetical protein